MTTGRLFVIAAPSGAGKTSLVKALLQREPQLAVSISYTTRKPRPNEVDGREYHFVSPEVFARMVDEQAFLEHARVFDHHYGTGRAQVEALRAAGRHVVLEIDWQGARQVRERCSDCHSVFILPPSREALHERLVARRTDSDEIIARRLRDAVDDMRHYVEFDSVVVNDDFQAALDDLVRIVHGGEAAYRPDRPGLAPVLRNLLA